MTDKHIFLLRKSSQSVSWNGYQYYHCFVCTGAKRMCLFNKIEIRVCLPECRPLLDQRFRRPSFWAGAQEYAGQTNHSPNECTQYNVTNWKYNQHSLALLKCLPPGILVFVLCWFMCYRYMCVWVWVCVCTWSTSRTDHTRIVFSKKLVRTTEIPWVCVCVWWLPSSWRGGCVGMRTASVNRTSTHVLCVFVLWRKNGQR